MAERPRVEAPEQENNPEQAATVAVEAVLSKIEAKDAASRYGYSEIGSVPLIGLSVLTQGSLKIIWGVLKFAKKVIEKRGKMTFKEGYEIGKETFSSEGKKEK